MNFTESERLVFGPFQAGNNLLYADPLRAWRRLSDALDGEAREALSRYHEAPPPQKERVLDAFRLAVGADPFDPESGLGMTDAQADQALRDYLLFCGVCETTGPNSQTCSPSTPASATAHPTT